MNNFTFQNPVKLIFGKGSIAKLAKEIPADKKIMVTFGGGSVKKNGVYDQVVAALKGRDFVEFWGIEPNPKIETLRKAIAQGKAEKQLLHKHHPIIQHPHRLMSQAPPHSYIKQERKSKNKGCPHPDGNIASSQKGI